MSALTLTSTSSTVTQQPLTVDLSTITPAIPIRKTVMILNTFIISTTNFLNKFSILCDDKLAKIGKDLSKLEISLVLLETKINSIPWLNANLSSESIIQPSESSGTTGPPVGVTGPPVGVTGPPVGVTGPPVGVTGPPVGVTGPPVSLAGPVASPPTSQPSSGVALKDDPRYKKYCVMLRVGVSIVQIKLKMEQDGIEDTSIIEKDPLSFSDYVAPEKEESESEDD